jgi:hypothetical protein
MLSTRIPPSARSLALATLSALAPLFSLSPLSHAADSPIRHRFLCSDYSGGQVCIVGTDGQIEWRIEAKAPQDCWLLPNGNILFSHASGAREVTPAKQIVWEYKAPPGTEVHAAQPLPDGNVLVGECGTKRLVEVDRSGSVVREVPVPVRPNLSTHMQFRGARKLASGNYLVAMCSDRRLLELTASGEIVRTFPVPGTPVQLETLANGHHLVTCGYGRAFQELDPSGQVVWSVTEKELPNPPIHSITGAQRLPNGNTVLCDWLSGEKPHLYELTPEKQVVWTYADHTLFKSINQVRILDAPHPGTATADNR